MFNRQRWVTKVVLIAFGISNVAFAQSGYYPQTSLPIHPNVQMPNGGRYPSLGVNPSQTNVVQQDDEQVIVIQEQIQEKRDEIIVIQKDIKEIDRELRNDDPFEHGCDCRASLKTCDSQVFADLGLDPQSPTSCEDIWEKQPKLNRLPKDCRRLVRTCKRVDRKIARKENKQREKDLKDEIKELEKELREAKKNARKGSRGTPCVECYQQANERTRLSGGEVALGLAPYITQLGLGIVGASMYNKSLNTSLSAYNGYLTNNLAACQDYTQANLTMGIPTNPCQAAAWNGPTVGGIGNFGLMGGALNGLNGGLSMNGAYPYSMYGMNMNGYNPFGVGMNVGLNAGVGLGAMNPLGMGMSAGMWPYQMGMNSMYSPFQNGFGLQGGLNIGLNGGMGMNGYMDPYAMQIQQQMYQQQMYAQMYQQQMYQQQYGAAIAQQQYQQALYRYQQVMSNYSSGGFGYNNNAYGQFGLGVNIGIGGSVGFGGQPMMPGFGNPMGGSTF